MHSAKWLAAWCSPNPVFFDCRRPESFYEIVEGLSKGTSAEWVLHRITNLLRKYEQSERYPNLTARVEWHAKGLPSFALEDKHLSKVQGTRVTSECLALTIFSAEVDESTLGEVAADKLLVHCIIKRNHGAEPVSGNVWEAILRPCLLLNNYVNGLIPRPSN